MATRTLDLWDLVKGKPQIDPDDLAEAVCQQASEPVLDYRTRLLIRDSVVALQARWGDAKAERWLSRCLCREQIEAICQENFDKIGFPSIGRRLMEKTKPEVIRQYLEQLGQRLHHDITIYIAGSVALILPGYLSRSTDDIDIVDEVPAEIRKDHALLHTLEDSYGLKLGHVQRHYFPPGWQGRAHSMSRFGRLSVFLVDVYDVFLSKLFSSRQKDIDDLRLLIPQLDKKTLTRKVKTDCGDFLAAPRLSEIAHDNWKILFGEELPS